MRHFLNNVTGSIPSLVVGVVAFLIACIVGVLIFYKLNYALYFSVSGVGKGAQTAFNSSFDSLNATANSVWTLAPVVGLVLIAGAIIATILMFSGGQQQ